MEAFSAFIRHHPIITLDASSSTEAHAAVIQSMIILQSCVATHADAASIKDFAIVRISTFISIMQFHNSRFTYRLIYAPSSCASLHDDVVDTDIKENTTSSLDIDKTIDINPFYSCCFVVLYLLSRNEQNKRPISMSNPNTQKMTLSQ